MMHRNWITEIKAIDDRRDIIIGGDEESTLKLALEHFIDTANYSIISHNHFSVALSGGTTPRIIYENLSENNYSKRLDWQKVRLYWSDERSVPPDHKDSNYKMAMDAGLKKIVPSNQIFRMHAETDIQTNANLYDELLLKKENGLLDLVMLGLGEDGHTASLFPRTHGLNSQGRLVIANYVPELNTWRMSLTFACINEARYIVIYVLGKKKASVLKHVLLGKYDPDLLPIQKIGTPSKKALYIVDNDAASNL